jgi:hypothetical protein
MLVPQPPSPELALILCSLEDINETLKGRQSTYVEVESPPYRVGNPEASMDLEGGPPPGEITREIEKIKLPEFVEGRASECFKSCLEGMMRCFSLRDYASMSKVNIEI